MERGHPLDSLSAHVLGGELVPISPEHARRRTLMSMNGAAAPRRRSVAVNVAGVTVGGSAPVVVQSMTNTDTADADATARQVAALARAGSELRSEEHTSELQSQSNLVCRLLLGKT